MAYLAESAGIGFGLARFVGSGGRGVFLLAHWRPFEPQGNVGEFQKAGAAVRISNLLVVPGAISSRAAHGGPGIDPHIFCGGYGALQHTLAFLTWRLFGHRQVVEVYRECLDYPKLFVLTWSVGIGTPVIVFWHSTLALISGKKVSGHDFQSCRTRLVFESGFSP